MSEIEKALLSHSASQQLKKDFIKDGLKTSVKRYLDRVGNVLEAGVYDYRMKELNEEDKELLQIFVTFVTRNLLKDFKEVINSSDFETQTINLLEDEND